MTDKIVATREGIDTRAGLRAWFAGRGSTGAEVTLLPGPQATGYSHETIVFELADGEGARRLIARVEPLGEHNVFPEPDLSVEYRLLDALAPSDVPLPRLHGYEPDASFLGAPFYVMEFLEGLVPPDSPPYCMGGWLHESTPDERAAVWWSGLEAMTRVHLVDWKDLGFVNGGRTIGFDGELEYWERYIAFCGGDIPPVVRRAWTWLGDAKPSDTSTALCWGDSRLGNQMFSDERSSSEPLGVRGAQLPRSKERSSSEPLGVRGAQRPQSKGRCIGLLDWEMACLSDPVQDLAWFVYFDDVFSSGLGVPPLEGMPTREESVARYEELTGSTVRNLDYFTVFAATRFALIMQRLGTLQMEMGALPADSTFPRDNFVTTHLAGLCDGKGIP